MQSNLRDVLRKKRKAKRETFDDLTNRYYIDKQDTNESIKRFKSTENTSDDDDEDDDDYTESQKELLGEYVETENIIADVQEQLGAVKKQMKAYL